MGNFWTLIARYSNRLRSRLDRPTRHCERYSTEFSINWKMGAIGKTYPRISPLIPLSIGTTKSGEPQGYLRNWWVSYLGLVREQVKKRTGRRWLSLNSQAVKNTCNASVESKGFCFYKATNGIKRHLAIDTLGFPNIDALYSRQCLGWCRIKREVYSQHRLLQVKTYRYSQDHHPARSWVSPRIFDSGVRADLPRDHKQNPVSTFYETLKTRESSTRKMWICSGNSLSGWSNAPMLGK